jgi:hypothetical protein
MIYYYYYFIPPTQCPVFGKNNMTFVIRCCVRVIFYYTVSRWSLKRQCHEIFDPRIFSLNCTPGSPDSWAKTVLHIDSNSWSYSTSKIDSALCRIARSQFFFVR